MKKIVKIEGMSCQHCVSSVENAVRGLKGVKTVTVSLENKNAEVTFDETKTALTDIQNAIEEVGFDVVD